MIVKLTLEDALAVARDMREEDRTAVRALLGNIGEEVFACSRWQTEGPAWSLWQGDRPIAMFGISLHAPWAGTAWLVGTPAMGPQAWRKLLRHARIVAGNLHSSPIRRVEALVLEEWPAASRFAARLGFELEGTKRRAGNGGENFQIWAYLGTPA